MAAMQAIVDRPSWSIAAQYAPLMYLKSLIWQKDRTQKNEAPIFLRSMFLPSLPVFSKQRLNRSRPKNVPRMNLPRLRVGLGSARRFQNGRVRLLPNQCMPAWLLKANRISLSAFSSAGASPSRSADAFNWRHPRIATMAAMQAIVNRPSWSIAAQYAPLMYLKSLIGQKDRTQKNDAPIFLRSMFLPSLPVFSKQRLNRSRPKNVPRMVLPRLRVGLVSARGFQNVRVRLLPNQCMPAWLLKDESHLAVGV